MTQACTSSSQCAYLFSCVNEICVHDNIFPITAYTGFIYVLLPFTVMLSNISGLSAGVFKVVLMMDLLNYSVTKATILTYPIVAGAGLANLILILPKRHPQIEKIETTLVDYNLVLILIPSVIYGATLGVFIETFIPMLIQDILVMIVFSGFAWYFYGKYRQTKRQEASKTQQKLVQLQETNRKSINQNNQENKPIEDYNLIVNKSMALEQIVEYERGNHLKQVLTTIGVFMIFEVLSLLSQGKLYPHFTICKSAIYWSSFVGFTLLYFGYMVLVRYFTVQKMKKFRFAEYKYPIKLEDIKIFMLVFAGGSFGGFIQGILGLGSGNTMVAVLTYIGVEQVVASATSGYQMFFIGLASLVQATASGKLTTIQIQWFFGIPFAFGGALTYLMYRFMVGRSKAIIFAIVAMICVLSVVGTIPSIILTKMYYGFASLISENISKC